MVVPNTVQAAQQADKNLYEEKFHSEFAVVSLICGVLGLLLPLFSSLAIIFGIAGLMQTHREGMKGRWMAAAGIVLGFVGIILIFAAIIFGFSWLENFLMRWGGIDTLIGKAHTALSK
ncbi:MAG: DUF4190 domain-containing protein [Nanoarchaeota archaeon]